jgi:ribosomal-protein-alanine N-acetyltransferase
MTCPAAPITIVEAGPEAIDEMMATMRTAFDPGYGEAWTAAQSLSMMTMPGAWLSLARVDGHPAGFALNRMIVDEAELLLLAVDATYRRRGVARLLIDRTRELAIARHATRIHLEVRHNNPAYHLYANCGFSLLGRRKNYYHGADGSSYDALTLSCSLQPD